jgi:hypothetical protein
LPERCICAVCAALVIPVLSAISRRSPCFPFAAVTL